jgi:putative phage-type endonuclease
MLTVEQKKERMLGIGGSDIGALFGVSPFATPFDIYLSKVSDMPDESNESMERGNRDELKILDWYTQHTGELVVRPTYSFAHDVHPILRANIDGITQSTNIIIEAKSLLITQRSNFGKNGSNQIPAHYLLQIAHYCLVCNSPEARLVVKWNYTDPSAMEWGDAPYSIYVYKRDERIERAIIKKANAFWNKHVIPKNPPAAINLKDCTTQWPKSLPGTHIEANGEILSLVEALRELKKEKALVSERANKLEMLIKEYMSDNELLMHDKNVIVSWKNSERSELDRKKLKEEMPGTYSLYTTKIPSRTFRIKEANNGE